jgi:hypothetical protein
MHRPVEGTVATFSRSPGEPAAIGRSISTRPMAVYGLPLQPTRAGRPLPVRDAIADANDVRMRPIGEGFASTHTRVEVTIEGLALALGPERWEKLQGPCCTR